MINGLQIKESRAALTGVGHGVDLSGCLERTEAMTGGGQVLILLLLLPTPGARADASERRKQAARGSRSGCVGPGSVATQLRWPTPPWRASEEVYVCVC